MAGIDGEETLCNPTVRAIINWKPHSYQNDFPYNSTNDKNPAINYV